MEIIIGGMDFNVLFTMPKWQLVRYAQKVKAALPHEEVFTSGRKADIAYSVLGAMQRNPNYGTQS